MVIARERGETRRDEKRQSEATGGQPCLRRTRSAALLPILAFPLLCVFMHLPPCTVLHPSTMGLHLRRGTHHARYVCSATNANKRRCADLFQRDGCRRHARKYRLSRLPRGSHASRIVCKYFQMIMTLVCPRGPRVNEEMVILSASGDKGTLA